MPVASVAERFDRLGRGCVTLYVVNRYSERRESAAELVKRVNQRPL